MPYTDDPEHVPADRVRFLLGDTNNSALDLSDNEVAFLLSEEGDDTLRAAARGAEMISYKSTNEVDERRVGPLSIKRGSKSKSERFAALATALWRRIGTTAAAPYAGGISLSDKDSRERDTDRNQGSFRRRMQNYGLGMPGTTHEDLLG